MPTTASIVINGTDPGVAKIDLPLNGTVYLSNNDNTGVVSYEWVIVSQPAGAQDDLNPHVLGEPTVSTAPAPDFDSTKEGSYLIKLTVNKGLADESVDTTICAVQELLTGDRIPAPQETTEVSDKEGWATTAVTKILQRVTRMSDAGIFVAQNVSGGELILGKVVHMSGMTTIGTGTNERPIPTVDLALASDPAKVDGPLGVVVGNRDGEPNTIADGDLCRVMVMGGIAAYGSLEPGYPAGSPVYVSDTGTLSLIAGTVVRQVGDVAQDLGGTVYDIAISAGANSIPRGNALGDLTGQYPNPTVAKLQAVPLDGTIATPSAYDVIRYDPSVERYKASKVDLTNTVTGTLPIANGGTGGISPLTTRGIVFATSATALATTTAGLSGQPLLSQGASNPVFAALALNGANSVTGTLPVSNGGTGSGTALVPGGILYSASSAIAQSTPAAVGTGYILCSNASSTAGIPQWIQTLPVNRGGTGQSSGLTAGGVVYASSSSAMASTAAGTDDRVLVGGFGAGPTWNYVPTGAFASASVPIYALQGASLIFIPGSPTYSNNTTTFTTLVTGIGTLSAGMVTFHITAKDDGSDFYTQLTSATNNHNVRVLLRFLVTGPSGFSKTYNYSYYSAASTAAAQVVGSFSFPVIAFLAPTGGSYTFTAQAAVDTNGDSVQVGDYRFYAYQG